MFTEEDFEYYESNWNKHKQGRDAMSTGRSWKLYENIWDIDDGYRISNKQDNCWKKHRKSQYRLKKIHKKKKRKANEYWKGSNDFHNPESNYKRWYNAYLLASSTRSNQASLELCEEFIDGLYPGILFSWSGRFFRVTEKFTEEGSNYMTAMEFRCDKEYYCDAKFFSVRYNNIKIIDYHEVPSWLRSDDETVDKTEDY